jgi:O-antigen ligase
MPAPVSRSTKVAVVPDDDAGQGVGFAQPAMVADRAGRMGCDAREHVTKLAKTSQATESISLFRRRVPSGSRVLSAARCASIIPSVAPLTRHSSGSAGEEGQVRGTTDTDPAPSISRVSRVVAISVLGMGMLGYGVLGAVNSLLAISTAVALVVLVWTVVQRPQPSFVLLALPLSLVVPPLLVSFGGRSMKLNLSDGVILVALLAWAGRRAKVKRAWLVGNLVLVAWTTVSVFVSSDLGRSLTGLKDVGEAAVVGLIAATATNVSPHAMFRRLAWSAGAMSVVLTAQLASQGALDLLAFGRNDNPLALDVELLHNSATTVSVGPGTSNYVGAIILLGVISLVCYWSYIESTGERVAVMAVAGIGVLGIVGTGSKSQLISLGVVLLLATVLGLGVSMRGRGVGKLITATALGVMILLSVAAMRSYLVAVFAPLSRGISQASTVEERVVIWKAALATILENPVFGVGVADLHLKIGALADFPTAHDTVLNVAAETGVPGLLIYLRLLFVPILWCRKRLRRVGTVLIVGLLVAGLAEPTLRTGPYDLVAWLLVGSIVALASAEPPTDPMTASQRAGARNAEPRLVSVGSRRIRKIVQ